MKEIAAKLLPEMFLELPGFRLYALCLILLVLKTFAVALLTGATRARTKAVVNREGGAKGGASLLPSEFSDVERVQRAHRDDIENIPVFFAVGLVAVLSGASPPGLRFCFVVFTAARILHSVFYLKALQPWRSTTYGIGVLVTLGLMVLTAIRVLS